MLLPMKVDAQWQGHNMTIAAPNLSFTVVAWESPCPCLPQKVLAHITGDPEDKPAWSSFRPTAMTEHTVWRLGDCSVQCTTIGTWALLLGAWGWACPTGCNHHSWNSLTGTNLQAWGLAHSVCHNYGQHQCRPLGSQRVIPSLILSLSMPHPLPRGLNLHTCPAQPTAGTRPSNLEVQGPKINLPRQANMGASVHCPGTQEQACLACCCHLWGPRTGSPDILPPTKPHHSLH